MTHRAPCFLFKETRVNLDWSADKDIVTLHLPKHHSGPSQKSDDHRNGQKKLANLDIEAVFTHKELAESASVYYRPADRYPRCILWRVLEDSRVLELKSVDFTKPENSTRGEHGTTFRFYFPDPIKTNCVGFADAPDRDELVVYAMTNARRNKFIYTLRLNEDFILHKSATRKNAKDSDYCRTFYPSSFTLHSPHFLLPLSHQSVLISLQDGLLLKLEKSASLPEDLDSSQSKYLEKTYTEGSYVGFLARGLPWIGSGSVSYGQERVSYSAVVSATVYIAKQEQLQKRDSLLFTVSVNHTLKIWSLEKGTLIHACDLLNGAPDSSSNIRTLLDPAPSQLLTIIDASFQEDHLFYLVSFSPAVTGRFKFWAAVSRGGGFDNLIDLYPGSDFRVYPPTANAVWIISEFRITPVLGGGKTLYNLWVLWKSNTTFKVQNLQFHINDVPTSWDRWTTATADSLHGPPGRTPSATTSEDATDYWMNWIFYPGRFPDSVISAALEIYEKHYSMPTDKRHYTESTKAKVALVVMGAVDVERNVVDGSLDYSKYRYEVVMQWDRFCRLCTELDKQRGEALSLVADPVSGFVWTVNADGITALRECTESEIIQHNFTTYTDNLDLLSQRTPTQLGAGLEGTGLSDVMLLVRAAEDLMFSLSEGVYDNCVVELHEEVTQDAMYSVSDQMWSLYSRCLDREVSEDTFEKILNSFEAMESPQTVFNSILSSLFHSDTQTGSTKLSNFGGKVMITGSQEVIHINHSLLFSLVLLLLLVRFPENRRPFTGISGTDQLYSHLLSYLKEYEILRWMAKNSLYIPDRELSAGEEITKSMADLRVSDLQGKTATKKGSVLQLMLSENFGPPPPGSDQSSSLALSACIRQFFASLQLEGDDKGPTNVASALLGINAVGLAVDFLKYLPSTCWGVYTKALVLLKNRDNDAAAAAFKRTAYGLSSTKAEHSALPKDFNPSELEQPIGRGLPTYYLHVARLFEETKMVGYTVEFCKAAFLSLDESGDISLRTSILLKLFQAAVQVSLFDEAYLALTRYIDKSLQRDSLRELVGAMVEQNEGSRLCSYPFVGLQDDVDEALAFKCQNILDVIAGPPFHKVLYAWRIQRGDYRGAASILYERLQRLQTANVGSADYGSRIVTDGFLALLNVMSCVEEDQAWILSSKRAEPAGEDPTTTTSSIKRTKISNGIHSSAQQRKVVTLDDLKTEFNFEVSRQDALFSGGFFL